MISCSNISLSSSNSKDRNIHAFSFFFNQEIFYETIGNNNLGYCTDSQLMFFWYQILLYSVILLQVHSPVWNSTNLYLVHLSIKNKTRYIRPQNQGKCTLLSKNKIDAALLSHQKKNIDAWKCNKLQVFFFWMINHKKLSYHTCIPTKFQRFVLFFKRIYLYSITLNIFWNLKKKWILLWYPFNFTKI